MTNSKPVNSNPDNQDTTKMAEGSPTGFFKDKAGHTHPIFTSQGGRREPAASAESWKSGLTGPQRKAIERWSLIVPNQEMKKEALGKSHKNPDDRAHEYLTDTNAGGVSWGKRLNDFNQALHTAPVANGTVFRGLNNLTNVAFDKLTKASVLEAKSPVSFTTDEHSFFLPKADIPHTTDIAIVATKHNAGDISSQIHDYDEHEAVIPQGSRYRVVSRMVQKKPGGGRWARLEVELDQGAKEPTVAMAGSPTGYFTRDGKRIPIFTSPGGHREPMADTESWKSSLGPDQIHAIKRWIMGGYGDPEAGHRDWLGMKAAAKGESEYGAMTYLVRPKVDNTDKQDIDAFNRAIHTAPATDKRIGRLVNELSDDVYNKLVSAKYLKANSPASFSVRGLGDEGVRTTDEPPYNVDQTHHVKIVSDDHNAADLRAYNDIENEAVVPQGSLYKVDRVETKDFPAFAGYPEYNMKPTPGHPQTATIHVSYVPKDEGQESVEMSAPVGSPTGFFKDKQGNTHPIFTSEGGVRHPMEKEAWKKSITPDESRAISMWTSDSDPMRTVATGPYAKDEKLTNDWKGILDTFNRVVDRAPQYPGTIYRGINGISREAYNAIINSKTLKAKAPASFTGTREAGKDYAGHIYDDNPEYNGVMFVAKNHNGGHIRAGQHIQAYTNENEVIVPQGSTYKVDRVKEEAYEDPKNPGHENPRSGRKATVYIHYEPGETDESAAKMSSPYVSGIKYPAQGFFRDDEGKVHPIFQSGRRKPMKTQRDWKASLSEDELEALDNWQGGATTFKNDIQLDRQDSGTNWAKMTIHNVNTAVHRAPSYRGTIYRGVHDLSDETFDRITNAHAFRAKSPSSFSGNAAEAKRFAHHGLEHEGHHSVLFVATKHNGGSVRSALTGPETNYEDEVIVPQGSTYGVDDVTVSGGGTPGTIHYSGGKHAVIHIHKIDDKSADEKVELASADTVELDRDGNPVKYSKSEVDYESPARGTDHCMQCQNFMSPDFCLRVNGKVHPDDWCKLFLVNKVAMAEQKFFTDARGEIHPLSGDWSKREPISDAQTWNRSLDTEHYEAAKIWLGSSRNIRSFISGKFRGSALSYQQHTEARPEIAQRFQEALHIAPSYEGEIQRGITDLSPETYDRITGAKYIKANAPASFDKQDILKNEALRTRFTAPFKEGGDTVVFVADKHNGGDISSISHIDDEQEVVVPTGSVYKVDKVEKFEHNPAAWGPGRLAKVHLSLAPGRKTGTSKVELAASPARYFTGKDGKVHPVFEGSENRHPMSEEDWKNSLSKTQLTRLDWWTGTGYGAIKGMSRDKDTSYDRGLMESLHDFNTAVDTAPAVEGKVFRGMYDVSDEKFDALTKAKSITSKSPVSFSKSQKFAKDFGGYGGNDFGEEFPDRSMRRNSILLVADKHNAADISSIRMRQENGVFEMHQGPEEQEAVVPKGSTYRVKSVKTKTSPAGGRQALMHVEWTPGEEESKVELAEQKFFTDRQGDVHPIGDWTHREPAAGPKEWTKRSIDLEHHDALQTWFWSSAVNDIKHYLGHQPTVGSANNGSWKKTAQLFQEAVHTAPEHKGQIQRGVHSLTDEDFDRITKAKTLQAKTPVSFDADDIMSNPYKKGMFVDSVIHGRHAVLFKADKHNGGDISSQSPFSKREDRSEHEVVVPKGSVYRIDRVDVSPLYPDEQYNELDKKAKLATVHISWQPEGRTAKVSLAEGHSKAQAKMAAQQHFFTDAHGKVHPLSGDQNGRMNQFIEQGQNVWLPEVRGGAKNTLVTEIARRMGEDPETVKAVAGMHGKADPQTMYDQANYLIRGWAAMAGQNDNPTAVAHHLAAAKEFHLDSTPYTKDPDALAEARRILASNGGNYEKMYRGYLRAEYANTQDQLKKAGIDHVTLTRGMTWDPSETPDWAKKLKGRSGGGTALEVTSEDNPEKINLPLQPVTSWTSNPKTAVPLGAASTPAEMYQRELGRSTFVNLKSNVPRERILSTARTGRGALPEYEVTVLGGPTDVEATRLDHSKNNSFGQTAVYPSGETDRVLFAEGRPEGFFKDREGNTRPIFESVQRHPTGGPKEWLSRLTPDQKIAVRAWSQTANNKWMRSTARHKPAEIMDAHGVYDMIDEFNRAVDTAPEVPTTGEGYENGKAVQNKQRTIHRGLHDLSNAAFEKIIGAKHLRANGPVSFTTGGYTADDFFARNRDSRKNNITIHATSHNGADISAAVAKRYQRESEVIVPQGSVYKVDKVDVNQNSPLHFKRHAEIYISLADEPKADTVEMSAAPTGFFKDNQGKTHPIFESNSRNRHPDPKWAPTLDQSHAMKNWSFGGYDYMKRISAGERLPDARKHNYLSHLLSDFNEAVDKAPAVKASEFLSDQSTPPIYRGIGNLSKATFDALVKAKTLSSNSQVSFTAMNLKGLPLDTELITGDLFGTPDKNSVLFVADKHNAADISQYSEFQQEREAIVPKNTPFHVTGVETTSEGKTSGAKHAVIHISMFGDDEPDPPKDKKVHLAAPQKFFTDQEGKVHPITEDSNRSVRHPMESHYEWLDSIGDKGQEAMDLWFNPHPSDPVNIKSASARRGEGLNIREKRTLALFDSAIDTAPEASGRIYRGVTNLTDDQFKAITSSKSLRANTPVSFARQDFRIENPDLNGSKTIRKPRNDYKPPTTPQFLQFVIPSGEKYNDGKHNAVLFDAVKHNAGDVSMASAFYQEHESVVPQGSVYKVKGVEIEDLHANPNDPGYTQAPDYRLARVHLELAKPGTEPDEKASLAMLKDNAMANEVHDYLAMNYPLGDLQWVSKARWIRTSIPVSKIDLEGDEDRKNPPRDTETKALLDYVKRGKDVDPVVLVAKKRGRYTIVDGHHRTRAYLILHKPDIQAYVGTLPGYADPWKSQHAAGGIYRAIAGLSAEEFDRLGRAKYVRVHNGTFTPHPEKAMWRGRKDQENDVVIRADNHNGEPVDDDEVQIPEGSLYKINNVRMTHHISSMNQGQHAEINISYVPEETKHASYNEDTVSFEAGEDEDVGEWENECERKWGVDPSKLPSLPVPWCLLQAYWAPKDGMVRSLRVISARGLAFIREKSAIYGTSRMKLSKPVDYKTALNLLHEAPRIALKKRYLVRDNDGRAWLIDYMPQFGHWQCESEIPNPDYPLKKPSWATDELTDSKYGFTVTYAKPFNSADIDRLIQEAADCGSSAPYLPSEDSSWEWEEKPTRTANGFHTALKRVLGQK